MSRNSTQPSRLLADARLGLPAAVDRLLGLYRPYLKVLAKLAFDPQLQAKIDASDLVQETSLLAYRDLGQFVGHTEREFLAWLRQIMAHVAATAVRHHTRQRRNVRLERQIADRLQQSSLKMELAMSSAGASPSRQAAGRERAALLAEALDALPAHYRQVLILREFEGLAMAEIAGRVDRSIDSVHKIWARGLVKLQHFLKSYES